ncbi:hypothetical protein B0H65DRAFT_19220 [Neurospora tetraspora]|uniref:Uncharacterized protein n=1 Tax=Neurospora tetraspora TaxID=94610 RepID=A0AAE0MWA7_9PEZI|nr:hypothetical protein B0H65DRAFT_19220 [Neurospora tetraspora]
MIFHTSYRCRSDAYDWGYFFHPIPVGEKLEPSPGGFDVEPPFGRYLCAETTQLRLRAFKAPGSYVRDTLGEDVEDKEPGKDLNDQMGVEEADEEAANPEWQDCRCEVKVLGYSGYSVRDYKVILCDNSGEAVGVLFPNLADDIQKRWDAGSQGIEVDLVAISRGHTICWPQVQYPEKWNFYHVLWVEWIDGIAYRKGVGQVFRSAWERSKAEDVHLILG